MSTSSNNDESRHLVITGVGYRVLSTSRDASPNVFTSPEIRPNMGAAVPREAVRRGYSITVVARTREKLQNVQDSILQETPTAIVRIASTDILDANAVGLLGAELPKDCSVDLVQCAGLSSGSYGISNDNPYLPVEQIPPELPTKEFDTIVRGLLHLVHVLLPRWRSQPNTRLVVVNSMSGIRAYPRGYAHASAKAGLHNAVRSLCLELAKERIYVSEVNPGAVDTGFYDPEPVARAVEAIGFEFGYDFRGGRIPQMPPKAVADAVLLCLLSELHVLSVNAVALGQFPHQGA